MQKMTIATLFGLVLGLLGGWDILVQALVIAIVLDVLVGVTHAAYDGRLNSRLMRRGIIRKTMYFVLIMVAVLCDRTVFDAQPVARTLVCSFLLANEALSILEHAAGMGVPVPRALLFRLERLKESLSVEEERRE